MLLSNRISAAVAAALLLALLTSCASKESNVAGTSDISPMPSEAAASPSDTASDMAQSPSLSPEAPFTDDQIKKAYAEKNLSVIEIRDAGSYTAVHYCSLETPNDKVSRFDWFDRETGAREFVYGFMYADRFEITAEKKLTVLTTGLPPFDGYQQFPRLLMADDTPVDGATNLGRIESDYYMPLERSFTVGVSRPEALKNICYDGGSMLLTFDAQPGYEQEFHADMETVPKMTVTNEDGVSTVTLYNTILSKDFTMTAGRQLGSEPCPVSVTSDGDNTVVTFHMRPDAGRYNISCFTTPVERVPHAAISYEPDNFGYPKGW